MTDQAIFNDITSYLATHYGTDRRNWWYVGVASDIDQRLFGDHKVNRLSKSWVWRQAYNAAHARSAEALLLQRGHDGGSGGGNLATTYVYAFRKELLTVR